MNRYVKISAALAAFALLLVVMGLSTQGSVYAQAGNTMSVSVMSNAGGTPPTVSATFVRSCTLDDNSTRVELEANAEDQECGADSKFTISVRDAENALVLNAEVTIQNMDLADVDDPYDSDLTNADNEIVDGPNANPKTIVLTDGTAVITAIHQSSGLADGRAAREEDSTETNFGELEASTAADNLYQVKAFNGNSIRMTYRPANTLGSSRTITVDDVKPNVLVNSPASNLVTRSNVSLTFSADITDSGAGFKAKADDVLKSTTAEDEADVGDRSVKGRIQLWIGQENVVLTDSNFTAIDGGWRVSKTLNTSDVRGLGDKTPWYFSVEDLAGNTRDSSGNQKGEVDGGTNADGTTLVDATYRNNGYTTGVFVGRSLKYSTPDDVEVPIGDLVDPTYTVVGGGDEQFTVTPGSMATLDSKTATARITGFDGTSGTFTISAAFSTTATVSGTVPDGDDEGNEEDAATATATVTVAIPDETTFEIVSSQLITVDSVAPVYTGSTTGHVWNSSSAKRTGIFAKASSIKVTFKDDANARASGGGSGLDSSSVTPSAFSVAGNTVESAQLRGSTTVYLTLGENLGSTEEPVVNVASGVIRDKAGNASQGGQIRSEDGLGPKLSLAKASDLSNDSVKVTITTDEQLDGLPDVTLSRIITNAGAFAASNAVDDDDEAVAGRAATSPTPSQATALGYSYTVNTSAIPEGMAGGEFNVYVTGVDTQNPDNKGQAGDSKSAATSKAFTFELDQQLNDGIEPEVQVSDKTAEASGTLPKVEAVDPMIVTVKFDDEAGEYPRDSYGTVELLSAELVITFKDGTTDKREFNLTTEVSSPDNKRFTIPLLNPRVGSYELTVTAQDSAGNNTLTDGTETDAEEMSASWEVIPARPVAIDLKPGWNLVSLPFQPGNPAINSVINASHPADIVMTYDNASRVWLVSRRDAESGLFVGDIPVMTASTAYFIRTDNFEELEILRPPLATAAAAPPPPPAITVVEGWNLVPIVSNDIPTPDGIDADDYFGTLGTNGWLKALTFNTLVRTWVSVTPGETYNHDADGTYDHDGDPDTSPILTPEVPVQVTVGKGYWLYATEDGVIIP